MLCQTSFVTHSITHAVSSRLTVSSMCNVAQPNASRPVCECRSEAVQHLAVSHAQVASETVSSMCKKLTFNRDHASDLAIISKDKLLDCFKALLDKWLHIAWLLGLSQDLQQLIIGQEEEPAQAQRSDCADRVFDGKSAKPIQQLWNNSYFLQEVCPVGLSLALKVHQASEPMQMTASCYHTTARLY